MPENRVAHATPGRAAPCLQPRTPTRSPRPFRTCRMTMSISLPAAIVLPEPVFVPVVPSLDTLLTNSRHRNGCSVLDLPPGKLFTQSSRFRRAHDFPDHQ